MNVLIAVDDTPESRHAVDFAYQLFGSDEDYSLVSVGHPEPILVGGYPGGTFSTAASLTAHLDRAARDAAEEAAARAQAQLPTEAEIETAIGAPGAVICQLAADNDSSIIVIGSHDKNFWQRIFDASVGRYLIDNAPCPVLIVRG